MGNSGNKIKFIIGNMRFDAINLCERNVPNIQVTFITRVFSGTSFNGKKIGARIINGNA